MSDKPTILIIDNSRGVTGALISVIRSSLYLKNHFDFRFLFPAESHASKHVKDLGFEAYELPMRELGRNVLSMLIYVPALLINVWKLFRLQRQVRADLFHLNDAYNLVPALYKMFGGKTPYVCHFRFMPSRFPETYLRFILGLHRRFAAQLVVVSEAVARELPAETESRVIYDGLPDASSSLSAKPSGKLLLFPASYTRGKGQDLALRAFGAISEEFSEWKLRFVGSDFGLEKNIRYREELESLSRKLQLAEKVEWRGEATNMEEEYRNASIVLNFSHSESFSLTCQEAQFYGRPVIATNSGGPAEVIADGVSGLLVTVGDVEAMAAAMKSLMRDPSRRSQFGQAGGELMRERFSTEKTFRLLGYVYTSAVGHSA